MVYVLAGCAYNFSGFVRQDIKSISIPVFENRTIKYGVEDVLTKAVIDAFIRDNRLKVLDRKDADSILLGEIIEYKREPFSYDEHAQVKDYRIDITIKLTYEVITSKDKKEKPILEKELKEWFLYSYEETEEKGIQELCTKLADNILNGIMEGW